MHRGRVLELGVWPSPGKKLVSRTVPGGGSRFGILSRGIKTEEKRETQDIFIGPQCSLPRCLSAEAPVLELSATGIYRHAGQWQPSRVAQVASFSFFQRGPLPCGARYKASDGTPPDSAGPRLQTLFLFSQTLGCAFGESDLCSPTLPLYSPWSTRGLLLPLVETLPLSVPRL